MLSRLSIAITALTLAVNAVLLPQAALAVTFSPTLNNLVAKYLILPTHQDEALIESILHNPMMAPYIESPSEDLEALLNQLQVAPIEKTIILKQYYLGEIFKQAAREFTNAEWLHEFLTLGFIANIEGYQPILRPINKLADIRTFYEIIGILVQNPDPNIQFIAMELLLLEGDVYPSTSNFMRGIENFTAASATNPILFDQILKRYEELYRIEAQWLAQTTEERYGHRRRKAVFGFASELADGTYNPAFKDPAKRAVILKNLFTQVNQRSPTDSAERVAVRHDLISAIAATAATVGDNEAWAFTSHILNTSTHAPELRAALSLHETNEPRIYATVRELIDRLHNTVQDPSLNGVIEYAMRVLLSAGKKSKDPSLHTQLMGYLPGLFNHPNATVRVSSIEALRFPFLDAATAHAQLGRFLSDPDVNVRNWAISMVDFFRLQQATAFLEALHKIAQSDPVQDTREYAQETRDRLISRLASTHANCEDKLKN